MIFSFLFLVINTFSVDASQPVASINGEAITLNMLNKGAEQEIFDAEKKIYELRFANLQNLLISKLIKLDPKSKGFTEKEYKKKYISQGVNITDQDINNFIIQRRIPKAQQTPDMRSRIRQFLVMQNTFRDEQIWLEKQSRVHNIQVNLLPPEEPRFEIEIGNAPILGNKNAKVSIIEFSDFECPFCAKADKVVKQLIKKYGNEINVVYKHFPLGFHKNAQKAAEATICAQQQGNEQFWKMHDSFFANYRNLSVGHIKDIAKAQGLDYPKFEQCLTSGKFAARVKADMAQGKAIGVSSTPAFYINGRLIKGAQPMNAFIKIIEEELAQ